MIPHCDLTTGKIYGCKIGSYQWWHEKGHFEYNNKFSFLILIREYVFQFCLMMTVWSLYYKNLFLASIISWIIYAFLGLFEELWCNNFALKKLKK